MPRSQRTFTGRCAHPIARQVASRHFTLLAKTGIRVLYCLGCGSNGCAFRTQDWGVLKVSMHPGEAPLARILANRGRVWPFLPMFYGGWVIPASELGRKRNDHDVGVAWREELTDFEPARRERRHYVNAAADLVARLEDTKTPAQAREAHDEVLAAWADKDFSQKSLMALSAIAGLAEWSLVYGLDFHLNEFSGSLAIRNLGQSLEDDAIVIRDLGNFRDDKKALRKLERAVEDRAAATRRIS